MNIHRVPPGDTYSVPDAGAPLQAGAMCQLVAGGAVCSGALSIDASLRDGNDRAKIVGGGPVAVRAGAGDDDIDADSFGGASTVYGDGGDDTIFAGGDGGQTADGGPGDDTLRTGGGSGEAFEYGGPGSDVLYGAGTIGTMMLDAGTGPDVVVARPSGYPSTVTGGDGADIIAIDGVDSSPYETDGRYTVDAGAGDDTVIGGIHDDTVDAGADRDFVDVRDGGSDTVTCGSGLDVVRFDAGDTIAADCEIRLAGS